MLEMVAEQLGTAIDSGWLARMDKWGKAVTRFRKYSDGEHEAKMTDEMRKQLRVVDGEEFNSNYCDMVVSSMSDRLVIDRMDADATAAVTWANDVMQFNRFDELQMDVHQMALTDGDTFIFVGYDNEAQIPTFVHEPAWDGDVGMLVVYDRNRSQIMAAIKVWYEAGIDDAARRVNVYYPDRIEKYVTGKDKLETYEEVTPWVDADGSPVGLTIHHFKNRGRSRVELGMSELKNVVPLQDALNRTLYSMVMTAELTAFPVRLARGFHPPANLSPGVWVTIGGDGLDKDQVADASVMAQGQLTPFIDQAKFLKGEIGTISSTPLPEFMGGDSSSGEALKQREVGLVGKCAKFQVKIGNVWEDIFLTARRVQLAFGTTAPPEVKRFTCKWKSAQLRNDNDWVKNAVAVKDDVGEREFLRLIGPVFGYDEAYIEKLIVEKAGDAGRRLEAAVGSLPGFSRVDLA